MNGFRSQLSGDTEALRNIVKSVLDDELYDKEDLANAMNDVIRHSNVVNCVFLDDDPSFADMSDLEIEHIEVEQV